MPATAAGAFYAFTNWTGIGPFNFVGFSNFVKVFKTPQLFKALVNTVLLAVGYVVFTNIFGLGFALALNRTLKTRYLLRTLIFMPVVLSPVAVSFIWKFIFAYNGPLNQILGDVGLGSLRHDWLAVPKLALGCVLVVMVWQSIGFVAVVYLAGLATVPVELEEAAAIDGAGMWQPVPPDHAAADPAVAGHRDHADPDPGPARVRPGHGADRRGPGQRHPDPGHRDLPADLHLSGVRLRRRDGAAAHRVHPRVRHRPAGATRDRT